ncbi:sushi repeat-containing protein SRPX isoform X4 [Ahaetulla prasina]|uniref:sushi repeat-containing protein SRPX isoform X4 n=1 Tax=Ahaetulla prasina TaxID=499056 RepID=UPI002648820E|nr:sushi repeat-containing protein SRPX isoform X4 [Ahaetulla prasina]
MTGTSVCLAILLAVGSRFSLAYQGSGYSSIEDDEDVYAHNRYKDIPWCSPIKVKNGYANCRNPQEGHYRNVLGTTCDIHCQKGYGLNGPQHLICQSNKRWSGKVLCKQKRCPTLSMPLNGGFKCVDGAYFNSRCEYYCSPGYQLKGDRVVQCMDNKAWSGRPASCVDMEPPRIQCPSVKEKIAEPNKLTSRVFWDTPEGRDTADGILTDVILKGLPPGSYFSEGDHKIQYTVYDRAGNKGTCKFLVKVRAMNINIGVRTAAALLDQFYEKRRLLIISTPTASNYFYRMQLGILQPAQCGLELRHVTVIELVGVYPAQLGRIGLRLMPPALAVQLRLLLRIPHYNFYMVVVDKHGVDKERYPFPATPAELYALIDTFPLRKEEMKLQAEIGRSCP